MAHESNEAETELGEMDTFVVDDIDIRSDEQERSEEKQIERSQLDALFDIIRQNTPVQSCGPFNCYNKTCR